MACSLSSGRAASSSAHLPENLQGVILHEHLLDRFFVEFDLVVVDEDEDAFAFDVLEGSGPVAELDDPGQQRIVGLLDRAIRCA